MLITDGFLCSGVGKGNLPAGYKPGAKEMMLFLSLGKVPGGETERETVSVEGSTRNMKIMETP